MGYPVDLAGVFFDSGGQPELAESMAGHDHDLLSDMPMFEVTGGVDRALA